MAKSPSLALEARWFKKMNQPSSGTYQLAHAVRQNAAHAFKPAEILERIERSADSHMADHITAVSNLTARPKLAARSKPAKK